MVNHKTPKMVGQGEGAKQMNIKIGKAWAKIFLENWDRAVELWDEGRTFSYDNFTVQNLTKKQQEYARICCIWIIPNNVAEPHVVAFGGTD